MPSDADVSPDVAAARDNLSESVKKLQRCNQQVQRLVAKLGTASDSDAMRGRLRESIGVAKEFVTQVTGDLRRMKRLVDATSLEEMAVLRGCEASAQKVVADFRAATEESVRRERQLLDAERERRAIEEHDEEQPMLQSVLVERMDEFDYNAQLARERDEEIREIERTAGEVFELFKEMEMLVQDQDQQITQVDENVDRAAAKVTAGNSELQKAKTTANKSRKMKMWLLLIAFLALLIIVLWGSHKI
eukprot:TRINITY_DN6201_c0_g1_i1.p2 TRINITY_DN6201_c0_g1~~TRINITY_DN6201_c0_g1_i1.p2  ORF type:complete len:247 (+),score=121.29 TRINITY_DN6201_c0_g1_i1:124-864(+)